MIDSTDPSRVIASDTFPGDDAELAVQLHDAAEAVKSRLQGLEVDRVVVRRADRPPRPSNQEGPRLRLLTEGAVTAAARNVVVDTRIGTGKDTGSWHGTSKATVDAAAAAVLASSGLPDSYLEAAAAALAGLALP
ncbi:MAG: hypothetical protein ACYCU7_07020 [Acidimicrobiales bacterium]